jgi:hypothetical protein
MPNPQRAGKRPRAPKGRARADRIVSLALDFEAPLNEASDYVHALLLIGRGVMMDHESDGCAIVAAAWAASQRLDALRMAWHAIYDAARGKKSTPHAARAD